MFKRILYVVLIIAIIILLIVMWREPKTEAPAITTENNSTQIDTAASIDKELDGISTDSGIDAGLISVDQGIKSL